MTRSGISILGTCETREDFYGDGFKIIYSGGDHERGAAIISDERTAKTVKLPILMAGLTEIYSSL